MSDNPIRTHSWYETIAGEPHCAACGCAGWETEALEPCPGTVRMRERNHIKRDFSGQVEDTNDSLWF
jgi:hypothetical protein